MLVGMAWLKFPPGVGRNFLPSFNENKLNKAMRYM